MERWDKILKSARHCHTKQAWESLLLSNADFITAANASKPLHELFKLLSLDPQSRQYDPTIFGILIRGCLSCWNLELGQQICIFTAQITAPARVVPAAQLYLDLGKPAHARDIALKSLRLSNLQARDKCQLQILVCSSYVEEGKNVKAAKFITRIEVDESDPAFSALDRANTKVQLARLEFFLGRYRQGAKFFKNAAKLFIELREWEQASKALFNTAACAQNSGDYSLEAAFKYVEQSRQLAERYDLKGPLSHCEAFYGVDSFHHGNFAEAHEHFRRALNYLPTSDKSYRRLHILSMLALTYLASGRYHLARKFGKQTLELAKHDKSDRHRSRYISLNAELMWEAGKLAESQALLEKENNRLLQHGIHTLEEFSSNNRYLTQSAMLGITSSRAKPKINDLLKKQFFTNLDHEYAQATLLLCERKTDSAITRLKSIQEKARQHLDKYHQCLALLASIEAQLTSRRHSSDLADYISEFEILTRRMGATPLTTKVDIIRAGLAYHSGDFKECERYLRIAHRSTRASYSDKFSVQSWLATIEGRSCRLPDVAHTNLLAQQTLRYFAPCLQVLENHVFLISAHYPIDLSRHPAIYDLLSFLISKPSFSAQAWEIQTHVWKQSLNSYGWKQKIRNTIMRLRNLTPYSMAPLIIQQSIVRLYSEAISVYPCRANSAERKTEIHRMLENQPMTTDQISRRLKVSKATVKRELRELLEEKSVQMVKQGRNVFYQYANHLSRVGEFQCSNRPKS